MATINTDISQKIDIIIKAEDSLSLSVNITDSSNAVFSLAEYYVFFNIYGANSDDTIIAASNLTARNAELGQDFSQVGVLKASAQRTEFFELSPW